MRIAILAGLSAALLLSNAMSGQDLSAYSMTVEEYAVDGVAGQTTYRFYVDMANPDDFMSSVYGNEDDPFELSTTTSFYNDEAATGGSAGGVNPSFLVPPFNGFFPGLGYDSWYTIGIEFAPSGAETAVSAVESAAQPWIGCFDATNDLSGQSVLMNDVTGGAWYVLNGTPNGLPDAENQRVLIAQVTTDGDISGIVNAQIFENGIGENDLRPRFVFDGPGVYFHSEPAALGCTDPEACNYDEAANEDDGSCVIADAALCQTCNDEGGVETADVDGDGVCDADEIAGCLDNTACNYDALATDDAGNCEYPDAGYGCDGVCINDADGDGICDEFEIPGCTNPEACNYTAAATEDDGTCELPEMGYNCEGDCVNDADGDGICDEFEMPGCTDATACNYDAAATDDNGTCEFASEGYDCSGVCLEDADGDGVCDPFEVPGCTNAAACNYDMDATDDDGSCTFADAGYDCEGNCLNDADGDGVCDEFEIVGCSIEGACNYDPNATDPGTCAIPEGPCDECDGMGGVIDNDQDNDGICDADETSGCADSSACNYNASVTEDDGSCVYATEPCEVCAGDAVVLQDADGDGVCDGDEVDGCTDVTACNYDEAATEEDGSCTYSTAVFDCDGNCNNDADADGVCDEFEVEGCTDDLACNYDADATEDNGECEYADAGYDCAGNCINDADADGVCDEFEIAGCTDMTACNYDAAATDEDNSCEYADEFFDCDGNCINDTDMDGVCDELEIDGCTDMAACNYSAEATDNDGSCEYADEFFDCDGNCLNDADMDGICDELELAGCTDMMACNFDEAATDDDGSCVYADEYYDCDGNCINDTDMDGVCDVLEVAGCTDMTACNFSEEATDDDGSCEYPDEFFDCNGNCLNDADMDGICDELELAGCTDMMACNFDEAATDDDGSCIYADEYYDCDGNCINDTDMDGVCDELEVAGCTDMTACNFSEEATDDDGSCTYADEFYDCDGNCLNDADGDGVCDELEVEGCTDSEAYNYNPDATEDDGSCAYCDLTLVVDTVIHSTGNDGSIDVTVEGTVGGTLTFAWTGPDSYSSDAEDIDGLAAGDYTLVITDENGCQAEVVVTVDAVDSVFELTTMSLKLFPNPTQGLLFVESDAFHGAGFVRVTDMSGRVVLEQQVVTASHRMVLDVAGLANGSYTLSVMTETGMATAQVMVSH